MDRRKILASVEEPYLKKKVPSFRTGDTACVFVKVVEGESERVQPFEGVVLRLRGSGLSQTFTVRKVSFGIGVERTFFLHSPKIEKIEILKSGKSRRARLYYLRKLSGKAARITQKEEKELTDSAALSPEAAPTPKSESQTTNQALIAP